MKMSAKGKALAELVKRAQQGDDLAMDYASRMQRARDMGFDTDTQLYRGATDTENTSGIYWTTPDKEFASGYAELKYLQGGASPRVEQIYGNLKKPVEFYHAEQRKKPTEFLSEIMEQSDGFIDEELAKKQYDLIREKFGDKPQEINKLWMNPEIGEFMSNAGFDHIKVPEGGRQGVETIGILKPQNVRSVNAAFDPAKKDSANLLASVAGTGVGIGAILSPDNASADVGSITAPAHEKAAWLAQKMREYNNFLEDKPLVGMALPEAPADWMEKVAYGDDITYFDRLAASLGML